MRCFLPSALSALLLLSCGCDRESTQAPDLENASDEPLPLLEPAKTSVSSSACRLLPQASTLRARDGKADAQSVEVGEAVYYSGGLAVAAIRQGSESRALLFLVEDQGRSYEIDLGRVFGAVPFPLVAAEGDQVFVAISDNEATSGRLRMARLEPSVGASSILWGPSFSTARDESEGQSLALGSKDVVLAWDDYENAVERSRIRLVRVDRTTLKERGPVQTVSLPDEDAVEPEVEFVGGRWGLSYVRLDVDLRAMVQSALVDEPKRSLVASLLGRAGEREHAPIEVSLPDEQLLSHASASWGRLASRHATASSEGAADQDGGWAVAYRAAPLGGQVDRHSVRWVELAPDGSMKRSRIAHDGLAPGAPSLLGARGDLWFLSPGDDSQLLATAAPGRAELRPLDGLDGAWALARRGQRLATMKPSGLDFVIQQAECSF